MIFTDLISVVITTYNRSDALLAVLYGLVRQTDNNFEVVVVDDGSHMDHRLQVLESDLAKRLRIVHFWHPDVGFTASCVRNRGVALSKGRYLIFLDGDCVPEIDFIAQHRLLAQTGYLVNGSRVLLSSELTNDVVANVVKIVGRSWLFWLQQRILGRVSKLTGFFRFRDGSYRIKKAFSFKGIRSCNMAIWRSDFLTVDGFDESFVGWGHEDADLVLRLYHAGIQRKNGFCATEVFHLWHKEASRDQESLNAQVVLSRSKSHVMVAESGYSQKRLADGEVVITRLG
jgi:glycosyltransferase involved in cell wall biosynthesis